MIREEHRWGGREVRVERQCGLDGEDYGERGYRERGNGTERRGWADRESRGRTARSPSMEKRRKRRKRNPLHCDASLASVGWNEVKAPHTKATVQSWRNDRCWEDQLSTTPSFSFPLDMFECTNISSNMRFLFPSFL